MKRIAISAFAGLAMLLTPQLASAQLAKINRCLGITELDAMPCGKRESGWYIDKTTGDMHYFYKATDWLEITGSSTTVTLQSNQATTIAIAEAVDFSGGDLILESDEYIDNSTDDFVCLVGSGGTSNEDICFDLDGTNTVELTSTTSADILDLSSFDELIFKNDEVIKNDNNGEIEFGNGTEDTAISWGTDTIVFSSDTGVVGMDLAAVGTTITLANDQTIVSDTDNEIQLGDGTEDISFGFGTANEVTMSTDTGVTRVDFGSIGVKTAAPMMLLSTQHFCGQGANGTTATYIGPVLKSAAADETTYVYGAAGCDGLDNTTEGTADNPLDLGGAYKVVGMACTITGGTDDVYTFQMRDDTADVTGVTCNVTLNAGTQTCTVILDEPVTIAAASAVAVKQVAATDDNCSACDTECWVYYTW